MAKPQQTPARHQWKPEEDAMLLELASKNQTAYGRIRWQTIQQQWPFPHTKQISALMARYKRLKSQPTPTSFLQSQPQLTRQTINYCPNCGFHIGAFLQTLQIHSQLTEAINNGKASAA